MQVDEQLCSAPSSSRADKKEQAKAKSSDSKGGLFSKKSDSTDSPKPKGKFFGFGKKS